MSKENKTGRPQKLEVKSLGKDKIVVLKDYDLESYWTVAQQIFQEILATHTIKQTAKSKMTAKILREQLIKEIEQRFQNDEELKNIVLDQVPAERSILNWQKREGWDEAVWKNIRMDGLFTAEKRAQMIESIRKRGQDKSDSAAKLWLTLSGDFIEGGTSHEDKMVETFKQINEIIHNKKTS